VIKQNDCTSQTGERRYRHLFEHAPICIIVIDLTESPATILEVNRRAELVFGYPAAELVRMRATRLVSEEAVPAFLTISQQVQQGHRVTAETISQHRDGTHFPVRVIATPDPADARHMILTFEDITAEKQRRTEAEAIEAERRRIAQEIHDGVVQSLAGLRFKSALWSHLAATALPDTRTALDELQAVLTTAIADLRRAIFALRPLDLEALGFFPALAQLVGDISDHNQLASKLEVSGPQSALPAAYELPLFRIIQEGLSNIGQHARASSVLVCLEVEVTGRVSVVVRDNGCGFDPHQIHPVDRDGHFGLRQMRERVLDLNGMLDIHSAPGQGTELLINLPPIAKEASDTKNRGVTYATDSDFDRR
jgi:PAS domain S-box-containing protein